MTNFQGIALIITTATTSIGTLAGVWSTVHHIRRNEKIKLKVSASEGVAILHGEPTYDPKKRYTVINTVNIGQVSVKIVKAGAVYSNVIGGAIFSESMINGIQSLDHDQAIDFSAEETKKDYKVAYYYVEIRNGKKYKVYNQPRLWVWVRNVLHKSHIWKKPALKK
jgi:hypothetical protein